MAAGAVGGFALWSVIFPADLVKSRIQVNSLEGTFFTVTLDIIRKDGKAYDFIIMMLNPLLILSLHLGLTNDSCTVTSCYLPQHFLNKASYSWQSTFEIIFSLKRNKVFKITVLIWSLSGFYYISSISLFRGFVCTRLAFKSTYKTC